jgi:hypothetical protein
MRYLRFVSLSFDGEEIRSTSRGSVTVPKGRSTPPLADMFEGNASILDSESPAGSIRIQIVSSVEGR